MSTTLAAGTATSGAALSSDTSGILQLQSGSTPTTGITLSTAQSTTLNSAASTAPLIAQINGTEVARIDGSGRLGVGVVPNSGGAFGSQRIQVGATGGNSAATFYNNQDGSNSGVETLTIVNGGASATNNFVGWYTTTSVTSRGTITWNGSNMVYSNTSDQRLKENIVDAGSGLAKLSGVQIKSFDFIENKAHVDFGVIAQELHNVAPEAVSVGQDNQDGTIKTPWGVDTSVLVPAMIKAIQELSAQVTALQAKVA